MHIEVEILKQVGGISSSLFKIDREDYEKAADFIKRHLPSEIGWSVDVCIIEKEK